MKIPENIDVCIIGAGPIGAYTAAQLGGAGLRVLVIETRKKQEIRAELGYVHFDVRDYNFLGIPRPTTESGVFIGTFEDMWQIPLNEAIKFAVPYPTDMLNMTGWTQWLLNLAEKQPTVSIIYENTFDYVILNTIKNSEPVIIGVHAKPLGNIECKLVIDCTGRDAIVRNSLPPELGIPKLQTRPRRMFTVYMEEWKCSGDFPKGSNTYVCYKGFANQLKSDTTLVGISTLDGLNATRQLHGEFVGRHLAGIKHTIINKFWSEVPFDFPPARLVANGLLSVGDSVFQNKPFNGEGMASGMEVMKKYALPAILQAFKAQNFSQETLWTYPYNYFRGIGADFGLIRGTGETIVDLIPADFDWMYSAKFLSKQDMIDTWNLYKVKKGPISILRSAFSGLGNLKVFKKVVAGLQLGMKLARHYRRFPASPKDLPAWEQRFKKILMPFFPAL